MIEVLRKFLENVKDTLKEFKRKFEKIGKKL